MTALLAYGVIGAGGYLLGSIPTGYLVARARGVDIRSHGSGNIGATNAFRVLGKTAGVCVLAADALKGVLAVVLASKLGVGARDDWMAVAGGAAAIAGHNYTCWLNFKGGKGIATSAGVMGALLPGALGLSVAAWLAVLLLSRFVSLASITASIVLPISAWALSASTPVFSIALVAGMSGLWRHRANMRRLLDGTEARFGQKKSPSAPPPEAKP